MARTLHAARFALVLAALTFVAAPAWAQVNDTDPAPVPAYLLARVAHERATLAAATTGAAADVKADTITAVEADGQIPRPTFRVDVVGPAKRPVALPVLYGTLVALQAADFYTTKKGLSLGARETNPVMRGGDTNTMVFVKAASTAATILIAEKMWKKNKAGAIAMMLATNVDYGAVVANNARVIGELR